MGRQLQEVFSQEPQVVIMTPLLEGTDGVQKMSKSLGNYVGINESPQEMFGKLMSINDELMFKYYEILTDENLQEIRKIHPKEAKLKLAQEIVRQFHGKEVSQKAKEDFESVFSQKNTPDELTEYKLVKGKQESLFDILIGTKIVGSRNEIRRLLAQGAISFEGEKIESEHWQPKKGVLKVGKRRFLKLA